MNNKLPSHTITRFFLQFALVHQSIKLKSNTLWILLHYFWIWFQTIHFQYFKISYVALLNNNHSTSEFIWCFNQQQIETSISKRSDEVGIDVLSIVVHVKYSIVVHVIHFTSNRDNYTFNLGLTMTSVSSSTILSSTSALWTLILGAIVKVETFNIVKLGGVLLTLGTNNFSLCALDSPQCCPFVMVFTCKVVLIFVTFKFLCDGWHSWFELF
jgi:hypothetical protein